MSGKSILKPITLIFSFSLMGLFIAYRQGVFDSGKKEKEIRIESKTGNANPGKTITENPFEKTQPETDRPPELMPTSKSIIIPKQNHETTVDPVLSNDGGSNLNISAEELFIMSSSKSAIILEPSVSTDLLEKISPHKITNTDSLKKPGSK